jgi:hypothetical protein
MGPSISPPIEVRNNPPPENRKYLNVLISGSLLLEDNKILINPIIIIINPYTIMISPKNILITYSLSFIMFSSSKFNVLPYRHNIKGI